MSEAGNIVYSCEEHGLETYKSIKNNPNVPDNYIYCYFPIFRTEDGRGVVEKMWVEITEGNRDAGKGKLANEPEWNLNYQIDQIVSFETDKNDVTRAV